MRKFRQFAVRFTVFLCLSVFTFAVLLYILSSVLAREATHRIACDEAEIGVQTAQELLHAYAREEISLEALQNAVNPGINPNRLMYMLLDEADQLLCATKEVLPYLTTERLTETLSSLEGEALRILAGDEEGDEILLMAQRSACGTVLLVKPLYKNNRAMVSFRSLLLQYVLPLSLLMELALALLTRMSLGPVDTLVQAAERISQGETVEINARLPAELKPLGKAFNRMSQRLSASISALTYERDTMSLMLEGLDEGVLIVDEDGDMLHKNRMASRLVGKPGAAAYEQVMERLRAAVHCEQEPLRIQRGERVLLCVFRPTPVHPGALAVLRDVTEHERLERTRREYVANISHELRTPLASMRGIVEGLHDGLVQDEQERAHDYELLLGEVQRLSRLVNDLLELSSLQSSSAAFEPEEVDSVETLWELHDRTLPLAKKKGVALVLALPAQGLPNLTTNEDRLQQVLTILLDNAIKFTPEGGTVTLGAESMPRGIRFFVRDTGIGMDEYTRRHAFERFHQADRSHHAQGSGLGLSIAQEIMHRLGSSIQVRSEKGKGSEFSFMIRNRQEEQA